MAKFTIISDPNYAAGGDADFRVHRTGCRDISRHTSHPRFNLAGSAYEVEAETAEQAVEKDLKAYQNQGQDFTRASYAILPCCHTCRHW